MRENILFLANQLRNDRGIRSNTSIKCIIPWFNKSIGRRCFAYYAARVANYLTRESRNSLMNFPARARKKAITVAVKDIPKHMLSEMLH